jgi:DNA repair protein RadC
MYEWQRYEIKITRGDMATGESIQVASPESCLQLFQQHAKEMDQESFWVIALDHNNQCLGVQELYRGTVSGMPLRVGEILRLPILTQSTGIIVVHNHPTGCTDESDYDVHLTRDLYKACELLDVELLDHLIVTGDGNVTSLRKSLRDTDEPLWVNEAQNEVRTIQEIFA